MQVYLDMDGVLTDFGTPTAALFGVAWPPADRQRWGPSLWDMPTTCGCTRDEWLAAIATAGEAFWEGLPWSDIGKDLLRELESRYGCENVHICTSPLLHSLSSLSGKHKWLLRNTPQYAKSVIYIQDKAKLAKPGTVLIDDYDVNVRQFKEAGGDAVLVPRPWNTLYTVSDSFKRVLQQLDRLS